MPSIFEDSEQNRQPVKPVKISPDKLIKEETSHLHRPGQVSYTRAEIVGMATWGTIFFALFLFILYTQDVWIYSFTQTTAFHSYIYLRSVGDSVTPKALVQSGVINAAEQDQLERRVKALPGGSSTYYPNMAAAQTDAQKVLDFIAERQRYDQGDLAHISTWNYLRHLVLSPFGLKPPLHWSLLDPSTEDWNPFPAERKKDPNDIFKDM